MNHNNETKIYESILSFLNFPNLPDRPCIRPANLFWKKWVVLTKKKWVGLVLKNGIITEVSSLSLSVQYTTSAQCQ